VNQLLAKLTSDGADDRADQRAAAADRHPDHHLDGVGRGEFARIDDADLRHVERAGDPAIIAETTNTNSLYVLHPVAEEARPAFRVAHATSTLPSGGDDRAGRQEAQASAMAEAANSAARVVGLQSKPRMSLKSVRPLLPPKPISLRKKASSSA
jgi:hypothetical protein